MPKGIKGYQKGHIVSKETREKISKSNKGKKRSEEIKAKLKGHTGTYIRTLETRKKMSERRGEKAGNWRGGVSPERNLIRISLEYKLWEDSVKTLNSYICGRCGDDRVSKLTVHHIKNFSSCPDLRFSIDNGFTFCRDCHKEFHHIYGRKDNSKEQIIEFIKIK